MRCSRPASGCLRVSRAASGCLPLSRPASGCLPLFRAASRCLRTVALGAALGAACSQPNPAFMGPGAEPPSLGADGGLPDGGASTDLAAEHPSVGVRPPPDGSPPDGRAPVDTREAPAPPDGAPAPDAAVEISRNGLKAEYYDTEVLAGLSFTQIDPKVDSTWEYGPPARHFDKDTFSVRWTGAIRPRYTEQYTISLLCDDGARLWMDGKLVIDAWRDQGPTEHKVLLPLVAGRSHTIKIEYYEKGDYAVARLSWSSASQPREVIPTAQLTPAP